MINYHEYHIHQEQLLTYALKHNSHGLGLWFLNKNKNLDDHPSHDPSHDKAAYIKHKTFINRKKKICLRCNKWIAKECIIIINNN